MNYKTSGSYTITATLMGFKTVIKTITLPSDTLLLTMQTDSRQLAGVIVSAASRPIIERKIDRVTFNVENSIVASGGTAWGRFG